MSTMGAADGVIMPTIITVHIPNMKRKCTVVAGMPGIADDAAMRAATQMT
jgi:hypothetical protein